MNILLDGTVVVAAVYLVSFGAIVANETLVYVKDYIKSMVIRN